MSCKNVVLLPSLGRPASDFDDLCDVLAMHGYAALAIDPTESFVGIPTLHDLAADVVQKVSDRGINEFHLVGHAFGNRLARMVTADFSPRVASLTLLACGGYIEIEKSIAESLTACFDPTVSTEDLLAHVSRAFFAPGNDATVWLTGWSAHVAAYQRRALEATPRHEWWDAVASRVLVVQAMQDALAVPRNSEIYVEAHQDVATLARLEGAGHAMLPEQPARIGLLLTEFLDSVQ